MGFPSGTVVKNPPANAGSIPGSGDPLEEEMATRILAWRIPWTEEAGYIVHGVAESDTTE